MIFKQFYLNCLAHASYLIGDETTATAAVIDPQRDIDRYLEFAAEHKLNIKHVILTHLHADFVAGHLELRDRVGATIYLGAKARAEYRFTPLSDGSLIEFGRVRLKALETPGHTPESISILVYDLARSETEPFAVLTETLFSLAMWGGQIFELRSVGPPLISARCSTILCNPNFFRCPTRAWFTPRTERVHSAAKPSARRLCPRSANSVE